MLASIIPVTGLKHVLILSEGVVVNGSQLLQGITDVLPASVIISGGLAGDGDRFHQTQVFDGTSVRQNNVSAVAFYGEKLVVRTGSFGGWDPFGSERTVTRATGAVLFELDGKPILEFYKRYLGDYAQELPVSELLFPLSARVSDSGAFLVRTVLGIDEVTGSVRFAGDIPEKSKVRLMKANFNRLLDGPVRLQKWRWANQRKSRNSHC